MTTIQEIFPEPFDIYYTQWQALLTKAHLATDEPVDHIFGLIDQDRLVGTVAHLGPIIKQVAVAPAYYGGHAFNQLISFVINHLARQNQFHYFVYTTPTHQHQFEQLGFQTIAKTEALVFLEKGIHGFNDYLQQLKWRLKDRPTATIVMNANPLTLGHLALIQTAAAKNPQVLVLLVSAQRSLFTFEERLHLLQQATTDLTNVLIAPTADYLVSNATFPTYFLKDRAPLNIAKQQARLDATIFLNYQKELPIVNRYVGTEPDSKVTALYNDTMQQVFGQQLPLIIQPRKKSQGQVISASSVRQAIRTGDLALIKRLTPPTTYRFIAQNLQVLQHRKDDQDGN